MKRIIALAFAAVLPATMAYGLDLKIGTSADFPPWESVDTAGEIVGFDREFSDEVCKRISANCVWSNQAFDGLLPSLQVGKFDLVISGISINDERSKMVDFSAAYADAPNSIVAAKDSAIAASTDRAALEAALADKVIGVQTGTTHEQVATANFKNSTVRIYDRPDQIVDDMIAGRLDAGLMERSAWEPLMEGRDGLAYAGPLLTSADYPEFGRGQGVAMSKGHEEVLGQITTAIEAMLSDGTLPAMSEKWFGYDISAK